MRNLSLHGFHMIAAIIAIMRKPLSTERSDRSDNNRCDRIFSISAIVETVALGNRIGRS